MSTSRKYRLSLQWLQSIPSVNHLHTLLFFLSLLQACHILIATDTTPKMSTFLIFGATGGTGHPFIDLALAEGYKIRAIVRTPSKLAYIPNPNLQVIQGSINDSPFIHFDESVKGADYVVSMLGNAGAQTRSKINTAFVRDQLVPTMRRNGVKRFLYQSGG